MKSFMRLLVLLGACTLYTSLTYTDDAAIAQAPIDTGSTIDTQDAETIIDSFTDSNWFIDHALADLSSDDVLFLQQYLYQQQLQLWGELGTPGMVRCQQWCKPLSTGTALLTALGATTLAAYVVGYKTHPEAQPLLSLMSNSILAYSLEALGMAGLIGYLLTVRSWNNFSSKRQKRQSVEALITALAAQSSVN